MKGLQSESEERKLRRRRTISLEQARRGIYIDFEGFENSGPSLVGILVDNTFTQVVFESSLRNAAKAKNCAVSDICTTIKELINKCSEEDRLLIAYTEHEYDVIKTYCDSDVSLIYANAHLIAKHWKRKLYPDKPIDDWGLKSFLRFIDFERKDYLRYQKSTSRLNAVMDMLSRKDSYEDLTATVKAKWTKLLDHNRIDCEGMKAVTLKAANEMTMKKPHESVDQYIPSTTVQFDSLKKTTQQTYVLFEQHYSLHEIAEIRELAEGTIYNHLEELILKKFVDLAEVIPNEKRKFLIDFLLYQNYAGLKDIKDQLPETISYDEIKLALASIRRSSTFSWKQKESVAKKSINPIVMLGEEKKEENILLLISYTKSNEQNQRRLAASALGKLSDIKPDIYTAVPHLIRLLQDSYPQVRQYGIKALGKIGDPKALPALQYVLRTDEEEYNRESAQKSIQKIREGIKNDMQDMWSQ